MVSLVHLAQKSLGPGSGLLTMKQCCFRANAETCQPNYRVPSWETPGLEQSIRYLFKKFQFLLALALFWVHTFKVRNLADGGTKL